MHAATTPADDVSGFIPVHTTSLDIWFRAPSGQQPDVLEIGMHGRRHPRVEAYWTAACSLCERRSLRGIRVRVSRSRIVIEARSGAGVVWPYGT